MNFSGNALSVLHVHLTRKCNLPCLQCLAYAGPHQQDEVELAPLVGTIADAAALGYRLLSLSGGEPLLYPGFGEVLAEAHARGMLTDVATNGILITESRITALMPALGAVTVNIERAPNNPRRLPGVDRAAEALKDSLTALRMSRVPFTIRFTLTQENAGDLPWAAEFAAEQGARMLQIRPLELTGTFRKLARLVPTAETAALAWLVTDLLRHQHRSELPIHFDMFDCEQAAGARISGGTFAPSPLVIETDGTLVPFRCGFPRQFALGRIGAGRLAGLLLDWEERCGDVIRAVARATLEALSEPRPYPFVNLGDYLSDRARQATEIVLMTPRLDPACWQAACCQ